MDGKMDKCFMFSFWILLDVLFLFFFYPYLMFCSTYVFLLPQTLDGGIFGKIYIKKTRLYLGAD